MAISDQPHPLDCGTCSWWPELHAVLWTFRAGQHNGRQYNNMIIIIIIIIIYSHIISADNSEGQRSLA